MSPDLRLLLLCPSCRQPLLQDDSGYRCSGGTCGLRFGMPDGIPYLVRPDAYVAGPAADAASCRTPRGWERRLRRWVPELGVNRQAEQHFRRLLQLLEGGARKPRVLVLGAGSGGDGMQVLEQARGIELVNTDVAPYPRLALRCDAHDLPFADGSFDAVIAQAVLEHVADPVRCVSEVHRVLRPQGLVYADTPFMQQVHLRAYDFQRYTHLGHRRLFRRFEEIDSGVSCGPGMALSWSVYYFMIAFTRSPWARRLIRAGCAFLLFPLRFCDRYLLPRPGALDAASSLYFIGRRSEQVLPDAELVRQYRGNF